MYKSLLQTDFWAKFKAGAGWKSQQYGEIIGLSRSLPLGRSLLYFPEIPLEDSLPSLLRQFRERSAPGQIYTRFEFLEPWSDEQAGELIKLGLVKAFEDVQPEYRQWIDLNNSEAELLESMKPKGRYNIGLAQKHDLKIDWGITDQSIQALFELYQQTAQRADFKGRNMGYFQKLALTLAENQAGDIVVVSKDGEPLSALLLSFYDGVCSYLYGGSGGDRSLMAPYLAHWEAIRSAKQRGMVRYDLLAIAPFQQGLGTWDSELDNQELGTRNLELDGKLVPSTQYRVPIDIPHPHSGLTQFKTQFGGQSVRLLGSWDLVHSRIWYGLYRFIEKKRRRAIRKSIFSYQLPVIKRRNVI